MTLIQFANTQVPAWKLRAGVVVGLRHFRTGKNTLGHIVSFSDNQEIAVEMELGRVYELPSNLTWLEPH